MPYVCIGVPYWLGQRQAVSAVDAVRDSGIAAELGAAWVEITPAFGAMVEPVSAVNEALAQVIQAYPDHTPLIFAGDCTACIGAVKGLERQQPAVLWYDAHGDFNTPETTPSGFLGGMPLAALVGRGSEWLLRDVGLKPLAESDIILTDGRDLDPEEGVAVASSALTHLPHVNDLLTHPLPDKPLYIHFDTDVINTDEMPGMRYPAAGGPSLAEAQASLARALRDGRVAAVLFTLWGHDLPGAEVALANGLRLIRTLKEA